MTLETKGFSQAAFTAARRCRIASEDRRYDAETRLALNRAATRFMAKAFNLNSAGLKRDALSRQRVTGGRDAHRDES